MTETRTARPAAASERPAMAGTRDGRVHEGEPSWRLRDVAFAAVSQLIPAGTDISRYPELAQLRELPLCRNGEREAWPEILRALLGRPAPEDAPLVRLSAELGLSPAETLVISIVSAVEDDPFLGRVLARLQAPLGGSRPTLGLLARAVAPLFNGEGSPLLILFDGKAVRCGLLEAQNEQAPLAERSLTVPIPLCLALQGRGGAWPGVALDAADGPPVPKSVRQEAARHARALARTGEVALVIRSASVQEGRVAASLLAAALGSEPAFIESEMESTRGLGPWLRLVRRIPVFVFDLAPGERRRASGIPGYQGPILAIAGPDGALETARGAPATWRLPTPNAAEREALWNEALGASPEARSLTSELARHHRHGAHRIAVLGALARHYAALDGRTRAEEGDLVKAAWTGEGTGLDSLAEPMRAIVPDDALVASAALQRELDLLLQRCRRRDGLADGLGASASVRYRPGVRALFTGPSGSGKTLAAGWLASRLRLPLYRVDLASVTSKYIGETEKNLAQLLARAEQAEVVLLFDEADSLFGKRTDIRDSNDRFANAQTNYLLQRIESYDGLVILTSNSRARFDSAFARRLDWVIEFTLPAAEERRALWLSHLGARHTLAPGELNQLAALADIAGGHIRNAVLTAALLASGEDRLIQLSDCVRGLEAEYRKLGRPLPGGLASVLPRDR